MARPRKGEELKATSFIGLRVPDDLRTCIEELAKANDRPIADEVRAALEKHCQRNQQRRG